MWAVSQQYVPLFSGLGLLGPVAEPADDVIGSIAVLHGGTWKGYEGSQMSVHSNVRYRHPHRIITAWSLVPVVHRVSIIPPSFQ